MTCKDCGADAPRDPQTGYDADDQCPDCRRRSADAPRAHDYHKCTRVNAESRCGGCRGDGLDCMYDALSVCKVCGGMEGSLLPSCPGRQLTQAEDEANYQHYCAGTGPFACAKHGPAPHHICEGC